MQLQAQADLHLHICFMQLRRIIPPQLRPCRSIAGCWQQFASKRSRQTPKGWSGARPSPQMAHRVLLSCCCANDDPQVAASCLPCKTEAPLCPPYMTIPLHVHLLGGIIHALQTLPAVPAWMPAASRCAVHTLRPWLVSYRSGPVQANALPAVAVLSSTSALLSCPVFAMQGWSTRQAPMTPVVAGSPLLFISLLTDMTPTLR